MNGREAVVTSGIFLLLSIIILLQILSIPVRDPAEVQSDRFYEALNRFHQTSYPQMNLGANRLAPRKIAGLTTTQGAKSISEVTSARDEGDWLIWASRVEPKTLNPISAENDIYARWVTVPNIFEPLLVYDFDSMELKPWLAESYDVSNDGLEITFRLRDDIYFSDGVPVTTDDVIFTYQTIVDPTIDAANIANLYIDVDRAVQVNKRVVKFFMKRPYFKALEILSFWDVGILPKHIYEFSNAEQFNKHISNPVGSGPYVFEKWDVGREIVLRRNENYWGSYPAINCGANRLAPKSHLGVNIEKIVYRFITNTVAAIAALRSHQVDIIIPEPEQFADLANDKEFTKSFHCLAYWNPGVPFFYIGWNQDTPLFCDQRVRLAMTYLINRKLIVRHLLEGAGSMITGPFEFPIGEFRLPIENRKLEIENHNYDPAKAGQLLDQAGWIDTDGDGLRDKNGYALRFRFMYSSDSSLYNRLARFLKDELAKSGVDVVPDPLEWSVILNRLTNRQFEAYIAGWAADILEDPYKLFHSSQIGGGGCNYVGFRNPEVDALSEQIRRTINDQVRKELYHRLHRILHEEQPYTFLFTRPSFRLVDRRFKNVTIHKLGLNYLEWYVPKSEQRY